jgi:hypothetical protein
MSKSTLLRPQDLKQIASDAEMKKMDEELQYARKKQQQQDELRKAFVAREIQPDHQLQVVTFPSSLCTDRGRSINNADPDWPTTLTGFAKKAYDYYEEELRPLGYKLTAEIVTWPDGLPGDVAMSLKW